MYKICYRMVMALNKHRWRLELVPKQYQVQLKLSSRLQVNQRYHGPYRSLGLCNLYRFSLIFKDPIFHISSPYHPNVVEKQPFLYQHQSLEQSSPLGVVVDPLVA